MGVPSGYTSAQVIQAVPVIASSGLTCIASQTAFSAVTSVTLDNIFTSTYTNYKIVIEYETPTTNDIVFQLRASSVASTTGYYVQRLVTQSTGQYPASFNNTSSFGIMNHTSGNFLAFNDIELMSPQLAQDTLIKSFANAPSTAYTLMYAGYFFGVHDVATAFDGFIFSTPTSTMTGKYTVYGYAKAV